MQHQHILGQIGSIYWDVARFLLEMYSTLFKLQQKVNLKEVFSAADGHGDEELRMVVMG